MAEETDSLLLEAQAVRRANFGDTLRLHSVIYPLDFCTSGCTYCGLSTLLKDVHDVRGGMRPETFKRLMTELVELGYHVHELVFGTVAEDQELLATRIARWVARAREIDPDAYLIVNCDTLQPAGYRRLKDAGADAIWTFMEVMTPEIYANKHRSGLKADQHQRLEAPLRMRDAGLAVGNALLWGLTKDWRAEFDQFVEFSRQVGGFDFVATPVQQTLTLLEGAEAPADFDIVPPLIVTEAQYREICANLRLAFPDSHLVANTRLAPEFVYGEISKITDTCNGYVWTGSLSHPKEELAKPGHVQSASSQMDFFNPGSRPDIIQKMCPSDISVQLSL
jgi:biotin synthase-like enzyme